MRNARLSAGALLGAGTLVTALVALTGPAVAASSGATAYVPLADSVSATTDSVVGSYSSSSMQIEVAVAPRDESGLNSLLHDVYTKGSGSYHHFLGAGQFDARYAPTAATSSAIAKFLTASGLTVSASGSPFLVRATGPSSHVASAFHTNLAIFKDKQGKTYFANTTPVEMPKSLAGYTLGVIGLTNTVREHSLATPVADKRANGIMRPTGEKASSSCESSYPTRQQLFNAVNAGIFFPYGYGGGPGCSGLTPSQDNSLYDAPNVGAAGKGAHINAAVFELSAYQHSDIATWAHHFYGTGYTPPLTDVIVDGGPLSPICPSGDQCPPSFNNYAGDIEVDADIEMTLAIAPDVANLLVYNAPNDFTGQTELDEYTAIADQDRADTVSSSWAVCEQDDTAAYVQAENTVFSQMAAQGQSMFASSGDTGAFACIRSDTTTGLALLDPAAQPWVTSVGGTTFAGFNPGTNAHPSYPSGKEDVWNVDNLCSTAGAQDNTGPGGQPGHYWCAAEGAGGGGTSIYWGRPSWQTGQGVINNYTVYGNGLNQCGLGPVGRACREAPDVSADADEYTPYAEYCTANANTPFSACGFSASQLAPGWFGIGGTSLSSPFLGAIAADRDSYTAQRSGAFGPLVYSLFNADPSLYFHDIGPSVNNNGYFPTTPGYDMATGVGTPIMKGLITGA